MVNIYEQKMKVSASQTDTNVELGLIPSLMVAQDNMCEFFREIKCDGLNMVPVCNCFFVMTKSKIKFNRFIKWLDAFEVKTELAGKTKIRVTLSTDFKDSEGVFATCEQELCAMDASERSLRMLNTTLLPEDIETTKSLDMGFSRLVEEFTEDYYIKDIVVDVVNLDFYKHVNNVEYAKFMLSTLSLEFLDSVIITDFEIQYITESRMSDVLKIYKKEVGNSIYFQIVKDDSVLTRGLLNFKKK